MKTLILLALALLLVPISGCKEQPAKQARWEYKVVAFLNANNADGVPSETALFNKMGSDGWELVSVVPGDRRIQINQMGGGFDGRLSKEVSLNAIFKRPLP